VTVLKNESARVAASKHCEVLFKVKSGASKGKGLEISIKVLGYVFRSEPSS
jgi:hypothetical protein